MAELPIHVQRNQAYWGSISSKWVEPGRTSWESSEISWGIWSVPERVVGALGDLSQWSGKDSIELGCGTAYFSAWLHTVGMNPTGIDITPEQLATARHFQGEFGKAFPLIQASAEAVPLPNGSFDLVISEYGASIWCDPYRWIPEASRLLRSGGKLVFLRNSTLSILCGPDTGPITPELIRDQFGLHRVEYDDFSVEFHLPVGPMMRLLRKHGFVVEDLIDIEPPIDAEETRFEYMSLAWAKRWPSEEVWVTTKI